MKNDGFDSQPWTYDEALQRVPNVRIHLGRGELLAWGRFGDPETQPSFIPASSWLDSSFQDGRAAPAARILCDGVPVFDLRIFPVVEAPGFAEYLGHISLKDLFNRFVVGDPEVQHLAEAAIAQSPGLRQVYRPSGRVDYWSWPLDPDDLIDIGESDPTGKYFSGCVSTPETVHAQAILRNRYGAMIRALQSGSFLAIGDPVRDKDPQEVLATIWGAPGYYFDRRTGDLLQDRDWGNSELEVTPRYDNSERFEVRWRAVLLRPASFRPFSKTDVHAPSISHKNKFEERSERCFDYLCEIMRNSPQHRPKSKKAIFRDAKSACGENLGWDIFRHAWEAAKEAVPDAAMVWGRAGAPKKSSQK